MEKFIKSFAVGFGIALVAALLYLLVIRKSEHKFFDTVSEFFSKKELVIDDTPNVVESIKNISELTTASYFEEVVQIETKFDRNQRAIYTDPTSSTGRSSSLFSTGRKTNTAVLQSKPSGELVLIIKGNCRAGFDLAEITEEDVYYDADTLVVILPDAKILDTIINPSDYEIFHDSGTWSDKDVNIAVMKARNTLERDARKSGLLEKATKHGKEQVKGFLGMLGYKYVKVQCRTEASVKALTLESPKG